MREILFRGKRLDNGEWVQGGNILVLDSPNPLMAEVYIYEGGKSIDIWKDKKEMHIEEIAGYLYRVSPATVGQYTGLSDKNGTKIFEGDIVTLGTVVPLGAVKWGEYTHSKCDEYECEHYGWYIDKGYIGYVKNTGRCLYCYSQIIKVIGNIHDTPELLKGGAENETV